MERGELDGFYLQLIADFSGPILVRRNVTLASSTLHTIIAVGNACCYAKRLLARAGIARAAARADLQGDKHWSTRLVRRSSSIVRRLNDIAR